MESRLAYLAAQGMQAAQVADAAVAVWHRIHDALSPVVGDGGMDALFQRSLHLLRNAHPWLAALQADGAALDDAEFAALKTLLSKQSAGDAAQAHDALLDTFCDLLASLIGAPLTERLLGFAWEHPSSSGPALQDTTTP